MVADNLLFLIVIDLWQTGFWSEKLTGRARFALNFVTYCRKLSVCRSVNFELIGLVKVQFFHGST